MRMLRTLTRGLFPVALAAMFLLVAAPLAALQPKAPGSGPLAGKTRYGNPPRDAGTVTPLDSLKSQAAAAPSPALSRMIGAWSTAPQALGPRTIVYLDLRTGGPLGVQPDGLPWIPGTGMNNHLTRKDIARYLEGVAAPDARDPADANGVNQAVLEKIARDFMNRHPEWFPVPQSQLRLHMTLPDPQHYVKHVMFDQVVNDVPVENAMLVFHVGYGNLISFGGQLMAPVAIGTTPQLTADNARGAALNYAGLTDKQVSFTGKPELRLIIVDDGAVAAPGSGYPHRLVYSTVFNHPGETGTWRADVDARTGEILRFQDINDYNGTIIGGVQPSSNDGICPTGCEQPGFPMPFADTGLVAPDNFTDTGGNYVAGGASAVTTALNGQYVRITDTCGAISKGGTNPATIDMGISGGTDCIIPAGGGGAGNTHSSRDAFYNVNKLKEEVRGWLPAFAFNNAQVTVNVNLNQTCNAYWNGVSLNMFHDGGNPSCRNTGEIAMIFDHELGHGYDSNDGGGAANPGEAYADNTASIHHHDACIGRGFFKAGVCGGYGDPCTVCTGVRGSDWTVHVANFPHTVLDLQSGNNTAPNTPMQCPAGGDVCGFETHCAAYPITESVWDAAVIDLPHNAIPPNGGAACAGTSPGNPTTSSQGWTLLSKIWWKGVGTLGSQYTCAVNGTAGCGATTTFHVMKLQDDDDGNLTNGTPHAAELQCAFGRHQVGCNTDTNTDTTSCLPLLAPTVTGTSGSGQITLNWTAVTNATQYRVFRNEEGCGAGYALIATVAVPTLTYNDTGLLNGRTYYYQVQPVGGASNQCDGQPSACTTVTPQPCAGSVALSRAVYSCSDVIGISLTDSDLTGTGTHAVSIRSTTEPTFENKILTETPPNSGTFTGTFATGAPPPVNGDNKISVVNGDTITVRYVDASYCGTPNVNVDSTAGTDCVAPVISNVLASAITGQGATISWDTNELSNSRVTYGTAPPPATVVNSATNVTAHTVPITGLAECTNYVYSVQSTDPASNTAIANNGGAYFPFTTGKNTQPNYTSTDTPVAIPDNLPAGATSTIAVPDNKTVVKVVVTVNITHTYDGDLALSLIPPSGPAIPLVTHRGAGGDNFTATVLDDAGTTPISAGTPPFTGTFIPDGALSGANGINALGNWQLFVVDNAGVDVGTIDSWTLSLTYPAASCGTQVNTQSTTRSDVCTAGGAGSGDTYLDPGENSVLQVTAVDNGAQPATGVTGQLSTTTPGVTIVDDTASFPDMAAGAAGASIAPHFSFVIAPSVACGTVIPFQITYTAAQGGWTDGFSYMVGQPTSATNTYNSTDAPKPIPDVSVTTSTLTVPASGTITDVNVALDITHTYDADLDIFLIHPDGTRVELSTDNGAGGDNFTGTIFDDAAATAITAGVVPFTGSFRPEGLLSTLNGKPAAGTWTLEITDDAGADTGTLNSWSVTIVSGGGAPTCVACTCGAAPAMSRVNHAKSGVNLVESWLTVPGALGFKVYRNTGTNPGTWGTTAAATLNTLTWTDAGQLGSPTSQYYSVTDVSSCGAESPK